jgi:hypothetical protein
MSDTLLARATVIAQAHTTLRWDSEWDGFFEANNLGVPFAVALMYNGFDGPPSAYGAMCINETWDSLCDMLSLPRDSEFESIDDMLDAFRAQ